MRVRYTGTMRHVEPSHYKMGLRRDAASSTLTIIVNLVVSQISLDQLVIVNKTVSLRQRRDAPDK